MLCAVWTDGALLLEEGVHRKTPHQHYAVQLSIALDQAVWGVFEGCRGEVPFRGALVAPHRQHAVHGRVLNLFFEPHSERGRRLWGLVGRAGYRVLDDAGIRACVSQPGFDYFRELSSCGPPLVDLRRCEQVASQVVDALCEETRCDAAPALDDRVAEVRSLLRSEPGSKVNLERLAEHVRLSPSRLRHVFAEQMGIPIRSYVVWLRTIAGIEPLVRGIDVASTAHRAGFADQAAFARSYRKTWGVTPSAYSRIVRFPPLDYMKAHARVAEDASWLDSAHMA